MSSIGIERGMSGFPIVPVDYIEDLGAVTIESNVTSTATTAATGTIILTADTFVSDGQTIYEVGICSRGMFNVTNIAISIFENGVDLGRACFSSAGTTISVQRKFRRQPPAGPVTYVARLWSSGGGTATLEGDSGSPTTMWVRKIKRLGFQ